MENIFENSDFIYLLNQAPGDREILYAKLFISPQQVKHITYSEAGEGLIIFGSSKVPFVDKFPANSKLYSTMTTKLEEVARL